MSFKPPVDGILLQQPEWANPQFVIEFNIELRLQLRMHKSV